jgi:hypothetical protein
LEIGFSFGGNSVPRVPVTPRLQSLRASVASGWRRLECQVEAAIVFGDASNTAREDASTSLRPNTLMNF